MSDPINHGITEEMDEQPRRPRFYDAIPYLWRVVAVVVTLVMVVGAAYLIINRDRISVDAFRRWVTYNKVTTDENGLTSAYSYNGDSNSCYALFEHGLLVCSNTQLELYARDGENVLDQTVDIDHPVIDVSGDYAVVYDIGGTQLHILHDGKITRTYTAASGKILSARIDERGWLTLVEQATGYKASVTAYDSAFHPQLTENVSSAYVMDALVSPKHDQMAVVTIGEGSDGFNTTVMFYSFEDGTESDRTIVGSDVILAAEWEEEALWLVGEYGAYTISDGTIVGEYTDATRYLQEFSLGGDGFATLYFSKYQGGNSGSLTMRNVSGSEYSIGISEEVLSVSGGGEYIAVLTNSMLTIYDKEMNLVAELENSNNARRALMCEDGSVVLVSVGTAQLFIPK